MVMEGDEAVGMWAWPWATVVTKSQFEKTKWSRQEGGERRSQSTLGKAAALGMGGVDTLVSVGACGGGGGHPKVSVVL